jgi:hypothetical protein
LPSGGDADNKILTRGGLEWAVISPSFVARIVDDKEDLP